MDDIVIVHGLVITMDEARTVIPDGMVAIKGDTISAVGPTRDLLANHRGGRQIDASGQAVLPGLINGHTHLAMTVFRGYGRSGYAGLYNHIWPIEERLTESDCRWLALAGAIETLKTGTTCVVDHYFHMNAVASAILEVGVRGVLGHTIMEMSGPRLGREEFEKGVEFVKEWLNKDSRIVPRLAPHSPETVSSAWFTELRGIASDYNVGLHLHLAQSEREVEIVQKMYGKSPVQSLYDIDFLGPDVLAAHCVWVSPQDIAMLRERDVKIAYCPSSQILTGKLAPAVDFWTNDIDVCIGTDSAGFNDDMNMIEEIRMAGFSQMLVTENPNVVSPIELLEMATCRAARCLGLEDTLGSVEIGKKADLLLLDVSNVRMIPNHDIFANIVFAASDADVRTVIVAGEIVLENGEVTRIDEGRVAEHAQKVSEKIIPGSIGHQ